MTPRRMVKSLEWVLGWPSGPFQVVRKVTLNVRRSRRAIFVARDPSQRHRWAGGEWGEQEAQTLPGDHTERLGTKQLGSEHRTWWRTWLQSQKVEKQPEFFMGEFEMSEEIRAAHRSSSGCSSLLESIRKIMTSTPPKKVGGARWKVLFLKYQFQEKSRKQKMSSLRSPQNDGDKRYLKIRSKEKFKEKSV